MGRSVVALAVFGLLLAAGVVQADYGAGVPFDYNPKMKYHFYGELRPNYAYVLAQGQQDNNAGFIMGTLYEGTFSYKIVHSYKDGVQLIGVYGPRMATATPLGNVLSQSDSTVVSMEAPLVKQLDPFPSSLKGSWTPSQEEFLMLWSQTLFIRIDTEGRPAGALAGHIQRLDARIDRSVLTIDMEGNNGKYQLPADQGDVRLSSGTTNLGIGYMTTQVGSGNWNFVLYHTANGAGRLILQCPSGAKTITTQAASPITVNNLDLESLSLETMVPNHCFLYITTAEYVDGELYAYPQQSSFLDVQMSGAQMVPPVTSGYYAVASLWLERNSKWLYGMVRTNLTTADITNITLYMTSGSELGERICDLYPNAVGAFPRLACIVNQTHFDPIWQGETAVVVKTTDNRNGELRGRQTIAALASNGGSSNVGMIVGIVIGCVAGVALIVVITVVLVKKGTCTRSSKL